MIIETAGVLGPSVKRLHPTVYVLYTKVLTYGTYLRREVGMYAAYIKSLISMRMLNLTSLVNCKQEI